MRAIVTLILMLLFASSVAVQAAGADVDAPVDFDRDVRPILSNTCYKCHGPDSNKREAELRFDLKNGLFAKRENKAIVVPSKPDMSLLIERITSSDPDLRMPPFDQKQQLTKAQIDTLTRWIKQGAEYADHWSFEVPKSHEFPKVSNAKWPANAIDHFVLARLDREGIAPSTRAKKETLIRRVSLDLTGLPPTLKEVDAFLADDSPHAFEKVVERLLASKRYGEHMALPWLDAARYADSNGYQQDRTRTLWPWRDWVINAFNDNMPYDRFTVEQIAGDLLPNATRDQLVATGFNRNHMLNGEGGRIAEESRVDYVVDRVETTAAVWMGLTVGCARCHDHKYDPITQKEFYQLYAYFNQIDESGRVDAGGNANPVIAVPTAEQESRQSKFNDQLAELNKRLKQATTAELQQAWEKKTSEKLKSKTPTSDWQLVSIKSAKSEQGQTMTTQDDGSVLVTGKNPNNDNYTVEVETNVKNITGIRLETLAHPSFTNKGLARSDSGNFVLTRFAVEAEEGQDKKRGEVKLAKAVADFHQGSLTIDGTIDNNPNTGWAVLHTPDMTITRHAVYTLAKPLPGGTGTKLTIKLLHESKHPLHNIGRFRLSVTNQKTPQLGDSNPSQKQLLAALEKPLAKRNDKEKKLVSDEFRKQDSAVRKLNTEIAEARRQIDTITKQTVRTMIMKDRATNRDTYVLVRGSWNNPDKSEKLQPTTPGSLPPLPKDSPKNRLALANWLVSPENPLTARVTVNRIWQTLFGQGLVKTTEDFGSQGERPSHPQLLDWLASEFVRNKWNVKELIKLIVLSETYQQSSVATPKQIERDRFNLLLGRGARFRLTSHSIRDQALAFSGLLVEKVGGPPVRPYQPAGIWSDLSLGKIKYQRDSGESLYRRSLYTFWRRSVAPTSFFDVASRQVCKVRPSRTNTPLHALTLLNDTIYVEASRKFAERVIKAGGKTSEARLQFAFRTITQRHATEQESQAMLKIFNDVMSSKDTNKENAAKILLIGESPTDKSIDSIELLGYATLMNLLLNLDEVITKE
jgi:hypothetical protein